MEKSSRKNDRIDVNVVSSSMLAAGHRVRDSHAAGGYVDLNLYFTDLFLAMARESNNEFTDVKKHDDNVDYAWAGVPPMPRSANNTTIHDLYARFRELTFRVEKLENPLHIFSPGPVTYRAATELTRDDQLRQDALEHAAQYANILSPSSVVEMAEAFYAFLKGNELATDEK